MALGQGHGDGTHDDAALAHDERDRHEDGGHADHGHEGVTLAHDERGCHEGHEGGGPAGDAHDEGADHGPDGTAPAHDERDSPRDHTDERAHEHADSHAHGSTRGHDGHSHGVSADADRRWLAIALALIVTFMAGEVVVGVTAHSLALLSDAAHMLTDAASIILALVAMRLAARPAQGGYTYGLKRAEILSAQANGLTLLLLSGWLAFEAVRRLVDPPAVAGGLVLATALVGVAVNVLAAWSISKANRTSLNVEGAYQHILTDLFGFVATAIAGAVVLFTGFARADAVATLVVVALMLKAAAGLIRASGRVFMEAAPAGIDPEALGDLLVATPGVVEIHDLHVWEITSGEPALSAHVLVAPALDCHRVRRDLERLLRADFAITHTTMQVDHAPDELLDVSRGGARESGDPHCDDAHGTVHRTGMPAA